MISTPLWFSVAFLLFIGGYMCFKWGRTVGQLEALKSAHSFWADKMSANPEALEKELQQYYTGDDNDSEN